MAVAACMQVWGPGWELTPDGLLAAVKRLAPGGHSQGLLEATLNHFNAPVSAGCGRGYGSGYGCAGKRQEGRGAFLSQSLPGEESCRSLKPRSPARQVVRRGPVMCLCLGVARADCAYVGHMREGGISDLSVWTRATPLAGRLLASRCHVALNCLSYVSLLRARPAPFFPRSSPSSR